MLAAKIEGEIMGSVSCEVVHVDGALLWCWGQRVVMGRPGRV